VGLEERIDELYRLPLGDFTASRNALAKGLSGDEAKRVRALAKPTVVPWSVNLLFWKARPLYDRLIKTGKALRDAQIATLKGHDADVRRASEAHRRTLADAVARATELAAPGGSRPDADALTRMLEALSVSVEPVDRPGRWTELVQPAGFEALAGVEPAPKSVRAVSGKARTDEAPSPERASKRERLDSAAREAMRRDEAQRLAAERQRLETEVRHAEQLVAEAQAAESRAREAVNRAIEERRTAETVLASARKALTDQG
jgi:hypothetical protein